MPRCARNDRRLFGCTAWLFDKEQAMPDVLGHRAKIGTLVPATNTIVEAEYYLMAPRGVTVHTGRLSFGQRHSQGHEGEPLPDEAYAALEPAVRQVVACAPAHLIMGMSA